MHGFCVGENKLGRQQISMFPLATLKGTMYCSGVTRPKVHLRLKQTRPNNNLTIGPYLSGRKEKIWQHPCKHKQIAPSFYVLLKYNGNTPIFKFKVSSLPKIGSKVGKRKYPWHVCIWLFTLPPTVGQTLRQRVRLTVGQTVRQTVRQTVFRISCSFLWSVFELNSDSMYKINDTRYLIVFASLLLFCLNLYFVLDINRVQTSLDFNKCLVCHSA